MRLGQLARHLRISQKEITDYLTSQSITIGSGSNAKIEDDLEYEIVNHFKPELLIQKEEVEAPIPEETEKVAAEEITEEIIEREFETTTIAIEELSDENEETNESGELEASIEPQEQIVTSQVSLDQPDDTQMSSEEHSGPVEDEVEVIRVKKIKLEGIKVVGKIDLPEPKIKETPEEEESEIEVEEKKEDRPPRKAKQYQNRKRKGNNYHKHDRRETYEQRIAREKREEEREKRRLERDAKARKKQHYVENVQAHVQIKPSKKSKKKEKLAQQKQVEVMKSKNPIKRFWGWLNGEYDKY